MHEHNHDGKSAAEDEMQQKYLELNLLDSQMKQFQEQIRAVEEQLMQLAVSMQAVSEIEKIEGKSEVLIPITDGVFAKGAISDAKSLIVSIGAGTCVTKTPEETRKMLQEKMEELREYSRQLSLQLDKLSASAMKIEGSLREIIESEKIKQ